MDLVYAGPASKNEARPTPTVRRAWFGNSGMLERQRTAIRAGHVPHPGASQTTMRSSIWTGPVHPELRSSPLMVYLTLCRMLEKSHFFCPVWLCSRLFFALAILGRSIWRCQILATLRIRMPKKGGHSANTDESMLPSWVRPEPATIPAQIGLPPPPILPQWQHGCWHLASAWNGMVVVATWVLASC